ncbi:hypothetical protein Tco_0372004, partial [Tanacetum coccineum]
IQGDYIFCKKKKSIHIIGTNKELGEVKAFMALAKEERAPISKAEARNGEWDQISMEKS